MGIGRLRIDIAHWNGIRTVNHYQMLGYADQCWPFSVLGAYSFSSAKAAPDGNTKHLSYVALAICV